MWTQKDLYEDVGRLGDCEVCGIFIGACECDGYEGCDCKENCERTSWCECDGCKQVCNCECQVREGSW